MTHVPRHKGFTDSGLVRMLARLAEPLYQRQLGTAQPAFGSLLSQCLDWKDAVALAAALEVGAPAHLPAHLPAHPPAQRDGAQVRLDEAARVRSSLVKAISEHSTSSTGRQRAPMSMRVVVAQEEDAANFSTHRQHVQRQQQAMDSAVSGLRASLRSALAMGSPMMARLSAVDAVMEQALLPQVQRLTAVVPVLLERHFRRLREAQSDTQTALPQDALWLSEYRKAQVEVLLAELDFRFQPIEGLMAALRSTRHAAKDAVLQPT